jgi:hypothetical protein
MTVSTETDLGKVRERRWNEEADWLFASLPGFEPAIRDLVPSDIEIRRNLLRKPLAWKQGDPTTTAP